MRTCNRLTVMPNDHPASAAAPGRARPTCPLARWNAHPTEDEGTERSADYNELLDRIPGQRADAHIATITELDATPTAYLLVATQLWTTSSNCASFSWIATTAATACDEP